MLLYEINDVVIAHDEHKKHEESEADDVYGVCNIRIDAGAFDLFYQEEEQAPAIKRRERDEVYDCQVYGDQCGEGEQVHEPELCSIPDYPDDADRSGERRNIRMPEDGIMDKRIEADGSTAYQRAGKLQPLPYCLEWRIF